MQTPLDHALQKRQRQQAWRFGLPIVVFALLMAVLVGAVRLAQEEERENSTAKLIADTLWARQNIQFQVAGLANSLEALVNDPVLYQTNSKLEAAVGQLARGTPQLVAVLKGADLAAMAGIDDGLDLDTLAIFRQKVRDKVLQRFESRLDGIVGPFFYAGHYYLAMVNAANLGQGLLVGILDIDQILERELPWWFAQENQIDLLDADGISLSKLVRANPGAGVYVYNSTLELGGLPLQLRVNSSRSGPGLFSYGMVAALALLAGLLVLSLLLLWRDSRRRLHIETELEEEKLFRQSMQDSMAVGLRVWDLQGVIRYVNPAFCQMVGYGPENLVGMASPLPYWPAKKSEEYKRLLADVFSGNVPPEGFETVYQHKMGHLIDVLIVEAPLKDSKGVHTGWMSSVIDITDRKRSEALVAQQREKLQAASRFALVGEVASNIAHELNQPLATMAALAQAGLNLSQKSTKVEAAKSLGVDKFSELFEKLRDQAKRASRVVGTVQNLVRKRQAQREWVTVEDLAAAIRFMVASTAQAHEVRLHIELSHRDCKVYVDRIMVEQALLNLVKNACEAFTADQRIRNVWISTEVQEHSFEFSVRDNGPGLTLDNLDAFFQTMVSTKPDGLGLGLSLCRTVAEAHGGRLRAERMPIGGMRFSITLPMALQENSI